MDRKNDEFDVQIECVENMDKGKVIFYTHPKNKKYLETMLDIVDYALKIIKENGGIDE